MTVKNAAFFATVGMALWTLLLTVNLLSTVSGVMRGLIPGNVLLPAFIDFLAGLSLLVFFFVYLRSKN